MCCLGIQSAKYVVNDAVQYAERQMPIVAHLDRMDEEVDALARLVWDEDLGALLRTRRPQTPWAS